MSPVSRASLTVLLVTLTTSCGFAGIGEPAPQNSTGTVTSPTETPARVAMVPSAATIHVADTLAIVATALRANNSSIVDMTRTIWTTGPLPIGFITPTNGNSTVFHPTAVGTAAIYANYAGVSGVTTVTVVP